MQLVADLSEAVNNVIEGRKLLNAREGISWAKAKEADTKAELARILRAQKFNCRMVVLSAFNLVEAYINGLAWEYTQTHDLSLMSERKRNLLTEESRPVNLIDKLVKVPRIVAERDEAPLHETQDPLKTFVEVVKPFRDAIVHASPFEAPERFGGYDKLSRLYDLTVDTALQTVGITLEIISAIHRFVNGKGDMPHWIPSRDPEGRFLIER